jgi:hypothetical protein
MQSGHCNGGGSVGSQAEHSVWPHGAIIGRFASELYSSIQTIHSKGEAPDVILLLLQGIYLSFKLKLCSFVFPGNLVASIRTKSIVHVSVPCLSRTENVRLFFRYAPVICRVSCALNFLLP